MIQALTQNHMKRPYAVRQERFLRLYFATTPRAAALRKHPDLWKYVVQKCVEFVHERFPDATPEAFATLSEFPRIDEHQYDCPPVQKDLAEVLVHDEFIEKNTPKEELEFLCTNVAYAVTEISRCVVGKETGCMRIVHDR